MNANANLNAWNGRGNLRQLVGELQRQQDSRIDFVADTRHLTMGVRDVGKGQLVMKPAAPQTTEWLDADGVTIGDRALAQLAQSTTPAMPIKYARELAAARPEIVADVVNRTWGGQRRFIRCLDGRCRAILSDTYRVIDNFDLAFTALEVAKNVGADVLEASLSDSHMRIKFVAKSIWDKIDTAQQNGGGAHQWIRGGGQANPKYRETVAPEALLGGDVQEGTVHPVISLSNSETGQGGLTVRVGIFEAYCLNTALLETAVRQIHLGGRMDEGIYRHDTRRADAEVMGLKIRDIITAAFTADGFAKLVAKAKGAQATEIVAPTAAVGLLVEAGHISEARKDALLEHFLGKYDRTAWGLAQGLTRLAQDVDDADEANELETLAGAIIDKPKMVLVTA